MADTLKLFVSASNDLQEERELIGHVVTEIPVTLGWQINLTPLGMDTKHRQLILESDFHLIVFGEDIRAPVGYELHISRSLGRYPPILIRDQILRTIAGSDFLKILSSYPNVQNYTTLAGFRKSVLNQISQHLMEKSGYYDLKSVEIENLNAFLNDLQETEPTLLDSVTGQDSIILTRERFMPKNGVLIQPADKDLSGEDPVSVHNDDEKSR